MYIVIVIVNSFILSMNISIFIIFSKFTVRSQVNSNSIIIMNVLVQECNSFKLEQISITFLLRMKQQRLSDVCLSYFPVLEKTENEASKVQETM